MDELLSIFFWFLLVLTGKTIVIVGSFGLWRGESLFTKEERGYSVPRSLWFKRDGQLVVSVAGLQFIGGLFYVLLTFFLFWLFSS